MLEFPSALQTCLPLLRKRRFCLRVAFEQVALPAKFGGVMLFFVLVASQAGLAFFALPRVRGMTGSTGAASMGIFFMQPTDLTMTGPAICLGLNLLLL